MAYALFSLKENFQFLDLIHDLKYYGFKKVGYELGVELGKLLIAYGALDYDFIVPAPIHRARRRERGYNQSESIAVGLSEIISVPVNNQIIKRKRYTPSQTTLDKQSRMINISKAFIPYANEIKLLNLNILLVDDVLTTGSTINEAALAILEMGAKRVDAAVLIST